MSQGWVKLHRQITEWEWYEDANTFRLFMHLLLTANHKENKWKGVSIKKGEVVTGRIKLAKKLKLSEQQIRLSLTKLKTTNEITIKTTNKFSIIKLNNYNQYQQKNQQDNQPTTNKQPTNNHKQECKEGKEENIGDKSPVKISDHIQVINMLAIVKEIKFGSKDEYSEYIKRNVKEAAKLIKVHDFFTIGATMYFCKKQYSDWKLEGVAKNVQEVKTKIGNKKITTQTKNKTEALIKNSLTYIPC